mgnify:CR=1 FL=1
MKKQIFDLTGQNGKAKVIKEGNTSTLLSYTTEVATYNHDTNKMTVNGYYSATTGRHINAFLEFYGFNKCTKKELFKQYNLTK